MGASDIFAGCVERICAAGTQAAAIPQTELARREHASRVIQAEYETYMNLHDDFDTTAPKEVWTIEHSHAVLAWWRRTAAVVPAHGRLARVLLVWSVSAAWMERLGSLIHLRFHVAPSADPERVSRIVAAQAAQQAAEMWGDDWCPPV